MTARRIARLITVVALLASGTYVLVYLYRWEWNRAIVAGIFFLAAEIALIGSTMLRKLTDLERRLEHRAPPASATSQRPPVGDGSPPRTAVPAPIDLDDRLPADVAAHPGGGDHVADHLRSTRRSPSRHFEWLDPQEGRLGVFVPVLLGAGAMLSGVAYLVERVAGATATPALERRLADRVGALALPADGLVGPPLDDERPAPPHRRPPALTFAAVAATGAALWWGIDGLADLTQDRPSVYDPEQATVVDLELSFRDSGDVVPITEQLWATCSETLPDHIEVVDAVATGPSTARLVVNPALGEHAVRRFRGCLADLNLNRVLVTVGDLRHVPFTPAP